MTRVLELIGEDNLTSASMFAVEFVDPVTDLPVTDGLRVRAEGLGHPIRTLSGRYAWNIVEPRATTDTRIRIHAISTDGRFANFDAANPLIIDVPPRRPGTAPAGLIFRVPLIATGLYIPPTGTTAFAGQLVSRTPLPDGGRIPVRLVFLSGGAAFPAEFQLPAGGQPNRAPLADTFTTDPQGSFVAVMRRPGERKPDVAQGAPNVADGTLAAYLRFGKDNAPGPRFTTFVPIQLGRLVYYDRPLIWEDLTPTAPTLPQPNN